MIIFSNGGSVTGVHGKDGIKSRENTQGLISKYSLPHPFQLCPSPPVNADTFHLFKGVGNFFKK